jgi:hypothetical protein
VPGTNNGFQVNLANLQNGASYIEESANDWQAIHQKLTTLEYEWFWMNAVSRVLGTDSEYSTTLDFHESVAVSANAVISDLAQKLRQAADNYRKADVHGASVIVAAHHSAKK